MSCLELKDPQGDKAVDILLVIPWFGVGLGNSAFSAMSAEFPFTIAQLMTYVEKRGFRTGLLDLNLKREPLVSLEQALKAGKPHIVGISSYSETIVNAEIIAKHIKDFNNDIPVILGGFHATAMPEECLKQYQGFDYVMCGEAELALPILMGKLLGNKPVDDVPNLAYTHDGKVIVNLQGPIIQNLDELPFPKIEQFGFEHYQPTPPNFYSLPTIGLMASRGCPFRCTFCATHFQWNRTIRRMSRGLLVDWLEKFINGYGIRDFRFYDDTFTIPRRDVWEFCEEVLRRKLVIYWNCYSRADTIDEALAKLMKRAGCYHIKFGIEAGTQKSLDRMKKDITLEQADKAIRVTKKCGIEVKASFILGVQGETLEESQKTVDFALKLAPHYAKFSIMRILPGSEDFETWKQHGEILENFKWDRPLYPNEDNIKDLEKMLKKGHRQFYLSPRFFIDFFFQFVRNPMCQARRIIAVVKSLWFFIKYNKA